MDADVSERGTESLLSAHRNSEGLTPAESWRKDAARLEDEAASLARQAAQKRTAAFGYRRQADEWESERLGVSWKDVRVGDEISLMVFDLQFGHERERRTVIGVNWPQITLAEGDREYVIDASKPDELDRALRIEARP